ncbi:MAG: ATP-binding protein [Marinilabiliales bacterium]|nr:ATP-binding protein [Marinilabiliales bacterium]
MISRNFYLQLVFRTLLVVTLSAAAGWMIAVKTPFLPVLIILVLLLLVFLNLVSYLNTTNRRLGYFLDSVQNEDSMLSFPVRIKNQTTRDLFKGMDKVNKQIQELRIETRQQEQYFRTLLDHVATGIVTYTANGFVLHANGAARKLLGLEVLTHLRQLERSNPALFREIREIRPFDRKLVAVTTERGTIQLSLRAVPFKTKDTDLILLSISDIRNELDEKELDSWMKLIRVLMHEIMNSIAPITSLSESLYKYYLPDGNPVEPGQVDEQMIGVTIRGLQVIKEQGNGLIQFVESYRKLSRLSPPEKKRFPINALLERIRTLYASLENSSKVQLSVQVKPATLELFADENQIAQVLLNLVKNALEVNDKGNEGKILVMAVIHADRRPEIRVVDNGPGIPEEILEQIFVPFFTTRENGSGIGLSLSRQIMRLHGGSLRVSSVPGKETVFTLAFQETLT